MRCGARSRRAASPASRSTASRPCGCCSSSRPAHESRFLELAVEEGVLFKRGAYNFPVLAHDEETLIEIERVASTAFVASRRGDTGADGDGRTARRRRAAHRRSRALLLRRLRARRLGRAQSTRGSAPGIASASRVTSPRSSAPGGAGRRRTSPRRRTRRSATTRCWPSRRATADRVRWYVAVNPNDTRYALAEIDRCVAAGAIGVKLAAARRADDPLLDPIAERAAAGGLPILHHIWQHRRRHWPSQDASDGADLARLAARHPTASASSWRTSAEEGTTRTRSPPCATCRTSISTSPAAASTAGCSTTRTRR